MFWFYVHLVWTTLSSVEFWPKQPRLRCLAKETAISFFLYSGIYRVWVYWSQQPPSVPGPGILTFHLAFALGSLPVPVSHGHNSYQRTHTARDWAQHTVCHGLWTTTRNTAPVHSWSPHRARTHFEPFRSRHQSFVTCHSPLASVKLIKQEGH